MPKRLSLVKPTGLVARHPVRVAAVAVLVATFTSVVADAHAGGESFGGCTSARVVGYDARGAKVDVPARQRPTVCTQSVGWATSETTIAVGRGGRVFLSPAHTENTVAVEARGGWDLRAPTQIEYTSQWNTVDPYVVADPRTGRVFWVHATGPTRTAPAVVDEPVLGDSAATALAPAYGFQVYATDDGRTWTTANNRFDPTGDWEKIFVGPPPAAGPRPRGYPDVVYVCGNSPSEIVGPGRLCEKSLDGGRSFSPAGFVFPSPAVPDACAALDANNGVVDSRGVVYQPVTCAQAAYVAVSRDEGSSYSWHRITPAPGAGGVAPGGTNVQIAVDRANVLYAMWLAGDRLSLSHSVDGGVHWSRPIGVSEPHLHSVTLPTIAAGPRGHVAFAYYASTRKAAVPLGGYVTVLREALAREPLLMSSPISDQRRPLLFATGFNASPRADYIGATYDNRGRLWVGCTRQLGPPSSSGAVRTDGVVVTVSGA